MPIYFWCRNMEYLEQSKKFTLFLLLMVCGFSVVAGERLAFDVIKRQDTGMWQTLKKLFEIAASYISQLVRSVLPSWVINCLSEIYCFFDRSSPYSKCALYVAKCVAGEVSEVASCAYNLGSDLVIDFFYNDLNFFTYDYGQLGFDVLACAGIDLDYIIKTVRPAFKQ